MTTDSYGSNTNYTPQQQDAVSIRNLDICVSAGAGSGKTGVLVERYVQLIAESKNLSLPEDQKSSPDRILVITFTDKATREMKGRIVKALTELSLNEERRQLETAYISTIHGFCSRLLQENPFDAGVDPRFSVLSESQAKLLQREAFSEIIEECHGASNEIFELLSAVGSSHRTSGKESDAVSVTAENVENILSIIRGAGNQIQDLAAYVQDETQQTRLTAAHPLSLMLNPLIEECKDVNKLLISLHSDLTGQMSVLCESIISSLSRACDPNTNKVEAVQLFKQISETKSRRFPLSSESTMFDQYIKRLQLTLSPLKNLQDSSLEREEYSHRHCKQMFQLIYTVWIRYENSKKRLGTLDMDDLQAKAVALLQDRPEVRHRYQQRFTHLLIDEFQDTNRLQMRLVELLHQEQGNEVNNLFIVGDIQQSIYSFRHAEPELFRAMETRFREKSIGKHITLDVNFRSRPEILKIVETVFGNLWNNQSFIPLSPGAEYTPERSPSVELLLEQSMFRREYVTLEAQALAMRIKKMVQDEEVTLTAIRDPRCGKPVAYRDIAILMRSLTDIQKYEEAFARNDVPCFVVGGGRGYYARREVRDLLNLLTLLDSPLNDHALISTLRSPFVGVDGDTLANLALHSRKLAGSINGLQRYPLYLTLLSLLEEKMLPEEESVKVSQLVKTLDLIRLKEDRLPVGRLLEQLVASTQYDARLLTRPGGRRRLANIRKLLQIANDYASPGVGKFIERLRTIEKLSDREGDAPTLEEEADVVKIHTIHGAKGLEFPVVFLADLSRSLFYPERGLFACHGPSMTIGSHLMDGPDLSYQAIEKMRMERDKRESERLLYVAMTRARERLVLSGSLPRPGKNLGGSWADSLFEMLGVNSIGSEPELRTLLNGIKAIVAPLRYYASLE